MLKFRIFIDKNNETHESFEEVFKELKETVNSKDFTYELYDINDEKSRDLALKIDIDEVPALVFNQVKISGQLNEYFLQALISQVLAIESEDQKITSLSLDGEEGTLRLNIASNLLLKQSQLREDTKSFVMLIRETPDKFNIPTLKNLVESGTTIFLLTNFKKGKKNKELAQLGENPNILTGHIMRDNIHMTMSVTIRKNRPFFGSYLRTKLNTDSKWVGTWSPLLHDTVTELKKFYIPLFSTASPVQLDGTINEPRETNRVVAKVKDNIERVKTLFF